MLPERYYLLSFDTKSFCYLKDLVFVSALSHPLEIRKQEFTLLEALFSLVAVFYRFSAPDTKQSREQTHCARF